MASRLFSDSPCIKTEKEMMGAFQEVLDYLAVFIVDATSRKVEE